MKAHIAAPDQTDFSDRGYCRDLTHSQADI